MNIRSLGLIVLAAWALACSALGTTITVNAASPGLRIPREMWGNNIMWHQFDSYYQSSSSLPSYMLNDMKDMGIPSLRYPGGCFSDTFYWETAIGPKASRAIQYLNGCVPPAFPYEKAYFGVDEFLKLCEQLGAEPTLTLQFRMADATDRFEAENNYTEVTDAGGNNIVVDNFNYVSGGNVSFPDVGDAINLSFWVSKDGYFKLALRERSGWIGSPTGYWDRPGSCTYALDGTALSLTGDATTVSALDADGYTIWGTRRSGLVYLRYGSHQLTVTANDSWLKVDYIDLQGVNHDNSVKRAAAWVAYCNGNPTDTRSIGVDAAGIDWKTVGYWAALRGDINYGNHPESYAVKFWEVGNEAWGVDPYGSTPGYDPAPYCLGWKDYNAAISTIDPSLRLSISSNSPESQGGSGQWSASVVAELGDEASALHFHPYYPYDRTNTNQNTLYLEAVTASKGLQTAIDLYRSYINQYWPTRMGVLKLSASEWAAAYGWDGSNIDWAIRWAGTMAVADELGTMARNADVMESSQYWMLWAGNYCVLEGGTGTNAPNGYFKHGIYEVFKNYNNYFGDRLLPVTVSADCPAYAFAGWGSSMPAGNYPMLSAYASTDAIGDYLIVINKDAANAQTATINLQGLSVATSKITTRKLAASATLPNYANINTATSQVINLTTSNVNPYTASFGYTFPACSITTFVIDKPKPGNLIWYREAEDIATVYKDVAAYGNVRVESQWTYNSKGHMAASNVGDAMIIPFNIDRRGYYSIRLRERSGVASNATQYWTNNGYSYHIDGSPVLFTGDPTTVSPVDLDGGTIWGTAKLSHVLLEQGRHYLRITANSPYIKVDWLEVEEDRYTSCEAESSYTVAVNNSGQVGVADLGLDSGSHIRLQATDAVDVNLSVPYGGFYEISVRHRTGVGASRTSQRTYYAFVLDGTAVTGTLDSTTLSALDSDSLTTWGTVKIAPRYLSAGNHTLRITLTGLSDGRIDFVSAATSGPAVMIASPTEATSYLTNASAIDLSGYASEDAATVIWANSRGGSGSCVGTVNWIASGVPLLSGINTLTVTGTTARGVRTTDTLTVTYDSTPPTATINQSATQRDPVSSSPVSFTVTFSESVTGFDASDILLSGVAGATVASMTGSGTTYTVSVAGMTATGTLTATVKSGAAVDAAGNPNTASTSTDNSVVFVNENPDISEAKQRADGSTVAFSSKIVTGIYTAGFYIEDADRSAGTLVKPSVMPSGLAVGGNTCVYGTIRTLSTGERYIDGQASVL